MIYREMRLAAYGGALLLSLLSALSAEATNPKPDIAYKSRAATVSVLIDVRLKQDPRLLADSYAEGKRWAEERRAEAEALRKEDPDRFRQRGHTYERSYQFRSEIAGRYVSIVRVDGGETGGSNPNAELDTIIWDREAGERISIRPFFIESADDGATMRFMKDGVIASLKAAKKARRVELDMERFSNIGASLTTIGAATLAPSTEPGKASGLTFHFPQYAVGSYAEGQYVAFLPWTALKPYLTAEGARIFGGTRPKADEKIDRP